MRVDLAIEFVENNDILKLIRNRTHIWITAVPDLGFSEKVKARALDYLGLPAERVGAEENRGAKDPFEGCYQPAIFLASPVHSERFQHLRRRAETDGLALLPNGQRRRINRHDPVLPERQPIMRMTGDLESKISIAALIECGFR
jgi:hypothetical protein